MTWNFGDESVYCKEKKGYTLPSIMCFLESPLSVSALWSDENAYCSCSFEMINENKDFKLEKKKIF